jgi:hypothetical protein
MNAHEIEVCDAGARQRGEGALAVRRGPVEPRDESIHFFLHSFGRRGLEMDLGVVRAAGNDLHRLGMRAVAADHLSAPLPAHDHAMPGEHRLVGQRIGEEPVQTDHHLGDAAFGW